jgi:hypothetical protein
VGAAKKRAAETKKAEVPDKTTTPKANPPEKPENRPPKSQKCRICDGPHWEKLCSELSKLIEAHKKKSSQSKEAHYMEGSYFSGSDDDATGQCLEFKPDTWNDVIALASTSPVVVCCVNAGRCPIKYKITNGQCNAVPPSDHSNVITVGAMAAYPHTDTLYTRRMSHIPAENVGFAKLWFVASKGTVQETAAHKRFLGTGQVRCSTAWYYLRTWVHAEMARKKWPEHLDWCILLQRPGETILHDGRHVHFVLNLINTAQNPSRFGLSVGCVFRSKDSTNTWARRAPDAGIQAADGHIEKQADIPSLLKTLSKCRIPNTPVQKLTKKRGTSSRGFQSGKSHNKKVTPP